MNLHTKNLIMNVLAKLFALIVLGLLLFCTAAWLYMTSKASTGGLNVNQVQIKSIQPTIKIPSQHIWGHIADYDINYPRCETQQIGLKKNGSPRFKLTGVEETRPCYIEMIKKDDQLVARITNTTFVVSTCDDPNKYIWKWLDPNRKRTTAETESIKYLLRSYVRKFSGRSFSVNQGERPLILKWALEDFKSSHEILVTVWWGVEARCLPQNNNFPKMMTSEASLK